MHLQASSTACVDGRACLRHQGRRRLSSSSCRAGSSRRREQQQHPPAAGPQALGSWEADDLRSANRGGAAGPLRVLSPAVAEVAQQQQQQFPSAAAALAAGAAAILSSMDAHAVSMDAVQSPVAQDMATCRQNLLNVVGQRHPMLLAAADQIFSAGGKRVRPLIVFLVARATCALSSMRCAAAVAGGAAAEGADGVGPWEGRAQLACFPLALGPPPCFRGLALS